MLQYHRTFYRWNETIKFEISIGIHWNDSNLLRTYFA